MYGLVVDPPHPRNWPPKSAARGARRTQIRATEASAKASLRSWLSTCTRSDTIWISPIIHLLLVGTSTLSVWVDQTAYDEYNVQFTGMRHVIPFDVLKKTGRY